MSLLGLVIAAVMALAIILIPLGLPGLWIMVAIVGVGAWLGEVSGWILATALALAAIAELAEWLVVQRLNVRYGGSPRAFWGAVIGGFVGVLVGAPVPVIGSVIAGFLGSFIGAAAVTYHEAGDVAAARRVGWGVVVGRALSAGLKVGAGIVILVLGGGAWILR